MLLCMDAGNTLVKWALHDQDKPVFDPCGGVHCQATHTFKPFQSALPALRDALEPTLQSPDTRPTAVLLSNVLGPQFEQAVQSLCSQSGVTFQSLAVNSHPLVQSRYDSPAALGKDRWAACLAVAQVSTSAVNLLVSLGTATTLDVVVNTDRWQHLGGYIVPGVHTMLASLHRGTAELPEVEPDQVLAGLPGQWPTNTQQAIAQGVGRMQIALVQSMAAQLEQAHGQSPVVWLTGGHAKRLLSQMPHARLLEHAVFKGLVFNHSIQRQGLS